MVVIRDLQSCLSGVPSYVQFSMIPGCRLFSHSLIQKITTSAGDHRRYTCDRSESARHPD